MEKVALSNVQLDYLAQQDESLNMIYGGALPCDGLPQWLDGRGKQAFIVNTEPSGEPGEHWIAVWIDGETCELFDSFALPVSFYSKATPLVQWLDTHYPQRESNDQSIQSVTSETCGHYALFYLLFKSSGGAMDDFLSKFKAPDYLWNDKVVGKALKTLILSEDSWKRACCSPYTQCCT